MADTELTFKELDVEFRDTKAGEIELTFDTGSGRNCTFLTPTVVQEIVDFMEEWLAREADRQNEEGELREEEEEDECDYRYDDDLDDEDE